MLWSSIIKAIPFVVQVILVVVAVALFAFFDPFGIFMPTKLKLKDTPVDVRSFREIGQLITAEYYGEVVSSYAHEVEEKQDTIIEVFQERMVELLDRYVFEINELNDRFVVKEFRKNKILDQYNVAIGELGFDVDYKRLLFYVHAKEKGNGFKSKNLDDELDGWKLKKLVKNAVINGYRENQKIINSKSYLKLLFDVYEGQLKKEKTKKLRKKNLVMLGRGWVKAGFDFGEFKAENFKYDKANKNIYFIGFKPQILSATINPWFIPEEGVEGFEFLIVERKVRRDYKIVQLVKQRCLDQLIRKAHEREILQKAIKNARESLREFFSLLLDEEINRVIFYDNEFDYTYDDIIKNDTITGEELLLIEHLLSKNSFEGMDSSAVSQSKLIFIDSLLQTNAKTYVFNQYIESGWSPELTIGYAVSRNGVFDQYLDARVISNYYNRFCSLNEQLNKPKFNCNKSYLANLIKQHTNITVWRSEDLMKKIQDYMVKNKTVYNMDTLYTDTNQFSGIRIGNSEEPLIEKLIEEIVNDNCLCE